LNGEAYVQQISHRQCSGSNDEEVETVRAKPTYCFSERYGLGLPQKNQSSMPIKKSKFLQEIEEIRA